MVRTYKGIEVPENDDLRVEAVNAYGVLDTPPEQIYDDVTTMAAEITGCPVAYISIFDATRSWLKSSYGLPPNRPPRPREQSMCAPTICQLDMMVIEDLRQNPRYANLPAVVNPPHARFYCGVPLINRDAYALGTLCVWSPEQVEWGEVQRDAMLRLARLTMDALERRRDMLMLESGRAEVEAQLARSRAATERAEGLVYRLLPQTAAARLLAQADVPARVMDDVTVLCVRLPGLDAAAASEFLSDLDGKLDGAGRAAGLERVGLSGDAYFALSRDGSDIAQRDLDNALAGLMGMARASMEAAGVDCSVQGGMASGSIVSVVTGDSRLISSYWGKPMAEAYENARTQPV
ncbi:MAG: GAF domain-containing protein [Pseudomonadota bacterium]